MATDPRRCDAVCRRARTHACMHARSACCLIACCLHISLWPARPSRQAADEQVVCRQCVFMPLTAKHTRNAKHTAPRPAPRRSAHPPPLPACVHAHARTHALQSTPRVTMGDMLDGPPTPEFFESVTTTE